MKLSPKLNEGGEAVSCVCPSKSGDLLLRKIVDLQLRKIGDFTFAIYRFRPFANSQERKVEKRSKIWHIAFSLFEY